MPTPPDPAARDREAFEVYYDRRHSSASSAHRADCREAYVAGAAHGREDRKWLAGRGWREVADDLRSEIAALRRTNSEQAARVKALEAWGDEARMEIEGASHQLDRMRESRDEYMKRWVASCRANADLERIKTPTPAPHAELRDAVVECFAEFADAVREGRVLPSLALAKSGALDALDEYRAALRAATAESEPVREAAERLEKRIADGPKPIMLNEPIEGTPARPYRFVEHVTVQVEDLRAVLDALDSALARKGGVA